MARIRMVFEGEVPDDVVPLLRRDWTTDERGWRKVLALDVAEGGARESGWRWSGALPHCEIQEVEHD